MDQTGLLLIAGYFSALVVLAMAKTFYLPGKALFLLRAFLPSWKFFEDCGYVPELRYRRGPSKDTLGDWKPCLEHPRRRVFSLLMSPHANYLLASHSLIQQLIQDLDETDETKANLLESKTSYRLVQNLVQHQMRKSGIQASPSHYQFKLSARFADQTSEDMLVSPVYEA